MSREVLAPPLQRMGPNRSYRVNIPSEDFGGSSFGRHQQQQQSNAYTEQDLYAEDDDDEADGSYTVEELGNSVFKLTFHVSPAFYGGLIGTKGSTKRRIESETQTFINVPRAGGGSDFKKSEEITIKGSTRSAVCAARRKINLLTFSLRKRMRPTHFISVPMYKGEIHENFIKFKRQILDEGFPGITNEMFQTDERTHLTLITCILLDDVERAKGVELLKSCQKFLSDIKTPIKIKVSGLEIMNDDPSAVRVLYGSVNAPDLQLFGDQVYKTFIKSGLSFKEFERDFVKLHLTLINTRYSKNGDDKKSNSTIDAREILKRFGDFDFGSMECNELQLCVMNRGESSSNRDAPYKVTGVLTF